MKPINVGLLGIGTVGGGTWSVLARNREEIHAPRRARDPDRDGGATRTWRRRSA